MSTDQPTGPRPGSQPSQGLLTLASTAITLLTIVVGALFIQPRVVERRIAIDDRHILTVAEVKALPEGVLPVVLDRSQGQDQSDFRYQLLKLVMERSGQPYELGLSEQTISQDEAIAALDQAGSNHGDQRWLVRGRPGAQPSASTCSDPRNRRNPGFESGLVPSR